QVTRLTFVVDAPSMGLYSIIGADKALLFGLPPVGAILVGILSGTGGSLLADLAVGVPPSLFRPGKLRGVAAAAGVTVFVIGTELSENRVAWFIAGVIIVTALRLASLTLGWGVGPAENLSGLSEQMLRAIPVPSVPDTMRPKRLFGWTHRDEPTTPPTPAPTEPSADAQPEEGDGGSVPSGP
ncbi:MAG TPA: TRIC cation channel family protein, partial [Ilumatobacteraceae bacterium]|nr:TRIC cation channel family protein [Ilumatobacteraceae bacterium]